MEIPVENGKRERISFPFDFFGGRNRDRTCDIQLVRLALSQLSYSPVYMAGSTGLEPAASGVTGRRYNRLNYDPAKRLLYIAKRVFKCQAIFAVKAYQMGRPGIMLQLSMFFRHFRLPLIRKLSK